jgi:hypothetical protein
MNPTYVENLRDDEWIADLFARLRLNISAIEDLLKEDMNEHAKDLLELFRNLKGG